jgi:hypothetical protein
MVDMKQARFSLEKLTSKEIRMPTLDLPRQLLQTPSPPHGGIKRPHVKFVSF